MTPHLKKLIDKLQFLPGVGPKTAMRMAMNMLKDKDLTNQLGHTIVEAVAAINHCEQCRNFSEGPKCSICSDNTRDHNIICVIETPSDLMSVEESMCFTGRYYVLMGRISPIDGIGPEDIGIPELIKQCATQQITEVILATNSTVEGEVTAQYITNQLKPLKIPCSRIGYGMPIGGELEYLDGNTVKQALLSRKNWVNTH